jgi:nitroreductase
MDVFETIAARRSIKPEKMKSDPIDAGLLERVLAAANWAPTHGMTEPWRFVVFQGEGRRALAEAVVDTMQTDGDPLGADDPRRTSTYDKMLRPPVVAAIICAPSPNPKIVEHEELISVGMAVQNVMLAARSVGVASYWTSGQKAFSPKMAKFLGLVPPARCLGFLYLGYPAIAWPEGARRPMSEKLTWK